MVHFNFKQGLFQAKGEILQYIGEDGKEYVSYDYNFEEDIVPAINNLIPGNEKLPIRRELKNIKVFIQRDRLAVYQRFVFYRLPVRR